MSTEKIELFKTHYNIIATILFALLIVVAHVFSTDNYDWTKNTISDLGSQGYQGRLIMQIGFLVFGLVLSTGILMNGVSLRSTPILLYGLCVALTGIFCTKPFLDINIYSATQSTLHSFFAQIAGVAFCIGIITQLFYTTVTIFKYIHFTFFILVISLSALFGLFKNYQGITQRILYLTSLFWLIKYYKP